MLHPNATRRGSCVRACTGGGRTSARTTGGFFPSWRHHQQRPALDQAEHNERKPKCGIADSDARVAPLAPPALPARQVVGLAQLRRRQSHRRGSWPIGRLPMMATGLTVRPIHLRGRKCAIPRRHDAGPPRCTRCLRLARRRSARRSRAATKALRLATSILRRGPIAALAVAARRHSDAPNTAPTPSQISAHRPPARPTALTSANWVRCRRQRYTRRLRKRRAAGCSCAKSPCEAIRARSSARTKRCAGARSRPRSVVTHQACHPRSINSQRRTLSTPSGDGWK
jgi:hypothetical protein